MTWPVTFAEPLWFWGLLLLPLLAAFYFVAEKKSAARLAQFVAPKLRKKLMHGVHRGKRLLQFILTLLSLAALITALARPQAGFETQEVKRKGRDVVVAIDTSRSMLADDVSPNRLARAKLAVLDLLRILEGDRVALVAFAGSAFLQAPLTIDYSAVQSSLEEMDTNIIPKGGTNLAEAIKVSLEAFGKAEGAHKALVLFTDGEELDADALKAAQTAKDAGVRIFTVGVGSSEGAMIPIQENGQSTFVRDDSGKFVKTKLDESRLKEIADTGEGFYVHLENGSNAVQRLIDEGIRTLEEREGSQFSSRRAIERYQWPLGLAIVLFVLAQSFSDRRRSAARAAILLTLLPLAQAEAVQFEFFDQDKRAFNQGMNSLADKKPEAAAKALDHFSKASTSRDPDVRKKAEYNAANSLFLIGQGKLEKNRTEALSDWKEAVQHYDEALKIDPQFTDAKTNRDLVEKLIKEDEKKKEEQEKRDEKDKEDEQKKQEQEQQQNQAKNDPKKDEKDKKDQQQKESDQKDQQGQPKDDKDGKDGKNQPDQLPKPGEQQQPKKGGEKQDKSEPLPTPGEKKEGELKQAGQDEKKDEPQEGQAGQMAEKPEEEQDGKMSKEQARALIEAMQGEDERVNLREPASESPVLKDW
ncbi:MAG TPA: VWA domain-containing protein [Chthoniobacterales bacterium]|jgi:Ca-activated chloride channel family protein